MGTYRIDGSLGVDLQKGSTMDGFNGNCKM